MKHTLLAFGIAAACAIPGASVGSITSQLPGNQNGQYIVINGGTEQGQEKLKELLENCGINPDTLFQKNCVTGGIIIAGPSCPETEKPEESGSAPSLPEISEPEGSVPGASAPDTSVPEISAPDVSAPETSLPETSVPDVSAPGASAPDISAPETSVPDASAPDISVPEVSVPGTENPDTQIPGDSVEDTGTPSDTVHPYVLRIVELVNEERAKAGLSSVTLDVAACRAAQIRAVEIVKSFSHTRPDGRSFATALQEQGINYRMSGENIAWGQRSPEQVMEAWMNSAGHRANILKESFTHIGVGYYQENGVNYWTQLFFQ